MTLEELKQKIDRLYQLSTMQHKDPSEINVGIVVTRIGAVGPTPTVELKSISLGFDWNSGKCLVHTDENLREIDRDEIKALQTKYDDIGWKVYEHERAKNRNRTKVGTTLSETE